ncbi:amidohydrolase family protein [Emcibacter sp. SYSU 3D8]|uniref:amidohydrolase family protein n=1 Tax=Emcibacter sp. SYSU 3D8 TaxID=3133969 RepID=UPI0031FF3995
MDIVDSQIHFGPGGIDRTLAAMDALGIGAVLADEFWGLDNWGPGYTLPNGAYRVTSPTAELAAWLHPDRFSYVLRIDRLDPEADSLIRMSKDAPHCRAIRILPALTATELAAFESGAYDRLFALAEQIGQPVFVFIAGHVDLMPRYLQKFPRLQFVVDHCGMPIEANVSFLDAPTPGQEHAGPDVTYFDEVLKLAVHPNVALKWSHAQGMFGMRDYPSIGLRPYLRRALDAFGANRVMWASDHGGNQTGETWGELVHYIRDNPELSDAEKAQLMGGTVRALLNWKKG